MDKERRKKIVVPVVLLLGIFIGGAIVLRTQGIGAQVLTEGKKVLFPIASEPDADPDGDGLKNWQEETYKTDPRNPDTDGDGYLDGEEVASGYDPAIKAPNDVLEGTDTNTPRQAPKNLTMYLAQILAQKISSGEIAPAQGDSLDAVKNDPNLPYNQDLMTEAIAQIGLRAKEYFTLPELRGDIGISKNASPDAASIMYLSQLNGIFTKHIDNINELHMSETNILNILKNTIETKNTNGVAVLTKEYTAMTDEIKNMNAPSNLIEWHNHMTSVITVMSKIFMAVRDFQEDPAMAAAAIESYPPTVDRMSLLIEASRPLTP